MGIAKFYSWLRRKGYRGALQRYVPQNVSSFSFDLNGLIHRVAQEVYAYGEGENPVRKKLIEKMDPRLLEAEFHLAFGARLSEVIAGVQPRDTLVLAIDGVAPQAKIAQQRQRRFRAALESSGDSVFNSSCITPGTEFMKRLDNYIQRWIIGAKNALPPKVIYSSHMVEGEGEHKIFSLIREGEVIGNGAHAIFGMDADLIMLSMLAPLDQIFLIRENLTDVIDIDNLKMGIQEEMNSIEDFVVMIFLLGNDFLPHLPTLSDMEEAIDTMIRIYNMENLKLTDGKDIDWNGLSEFLSAMAKEEPRLLELESERDVMFPSKMMEAATSKTSSIQTGGKIIKTSRFDPNIYRAAWYENAIGLKGPKANNVFSKILPKFKFGVTNDKVVKMVKAYLDGIGWVYRYYSSGKNHVNNDYVYRYLYSPLFSDMALVSNKYVPNKETYEFNPNAIVINPVHQLLSVLPLKSKNLLPDEVKHLMNIDSMIGDYYSESQILDRGGYNTEWQGTLLINFVDMNRVKDAVERTSVFTPDRIVEFSPVLNIVLVKDRTVMDLNRRTQKFKNYLDKSTGNRGRGNTQYSKGRGSSYGRGQSGRGKTSFGRGGRGQSQYSGRGRANKDRGGEQFERSSISLPPSKQQQRTKQPVQKFEI